MNSHTHCRYKIFYSLKYILPTMFNEYITSLHHWGELLLGSIFLFHIAISQPPTPPPPKTPHSIPPPLSLLPPQEQNKWKPIDMNNFDLTVKPEDDFYQYANGGWMKNNPIPADQSRWGSFNELQENNYRILLEILESAANSPLAPNGSIVQKVGDFYASGMDSAIIEQQGMMPLAEEFARIAALQTPDDVQKLIGRFHTMSLRVPFVFYADQDEKNSTEVIAHIRQGGLGLPDRDYYIKDDDNSKKIREQYLAHVKKMFALLGDDDAAATANEAVVMAFETQMANASMTRIERRDPDKTYHKLTLTELNALTPNFSWQMYFDGIGIPSQKTIIIGMPDFLKEINTMLDETPVNHWKTYLRWQLIHNTADFLNSSFEEEKFNFYGKVLTGVTEMKPRWKRILETVDGEIGEALGQLYVQKAFGGNAKTRAKEMVENLRKALHDRIQNLEWMSVATKKQAIRKLEAFRVKIGYPDVWRDYSSLEITRDSYVKNVIRAEQFEFKRNLAQIGKPVDSNEWGMTPPTVNAYYSPSMNEIVFPAGILQPPFFDANADDAINYGGIGAVIGHEMTHGFDDQGRKFDADGNLKDWWTEDDAKNYIERSAVIEKQFNEYVGIDTIHVNGTLTLGENTADLGGLTIAFAALQQAQGIHKRLERIDGFTPEQRFFLSWAQVWRQNIRDEALRLRLNTDPHSPGRFRGFGPLTNMGEFQKAFNISDGAPMIRKERAKIW